MKKFLRIILILIAVLIVAYIAGPKFPKPELSNTLPILNIETSGFESYLKNKEANLNIKPDNDSKIFWANDSLKNKTNYCLLYLHGYAACWYEGNPVNFYFARRH